MPADLYHTLFWFVVNFQLFYYRVWCLENLRSASGRDPEDERSCCATSEFSSLSRSKLEPVGSLTLSKHCLSVRGAGNVDMVF